MTKKEKKFSKIIKANLKSYKFIDLKNFLEHYGFEGENTGGSHWTFRRGECPHINFPVKYQAVKGGYVKRTIQILKEYQII